jgi:GNAT superfamily N-acetyltransferase
LGEAALSRLAESLLPGTIASAKLRRVEIIRARPSDAATLSAIAWAAKAFWRYPPHWMEKWREQLTITPEFISENETFAAVIDRQMVAFHALVPTSETLRLEHLWVLPERIGQGLGQTLFLHAAEQARAQGATSLTIEADPRAEAFYQHLGAVRVGTIASEIDGCRRELPLLEFDLTKSGFPR